MDVSNKVYFKLNEPINVCWIFWFNKIKWDITLTLLSQPPTLMNTIQDHLDGASGNSSPSSLDCCSFVSSSVSASIATEEDNSVSQLSEPSLLEEFIIDDPYIPHHLYIYTIYSLSISFFTPPDSIPSSILSYLIKIKYQSNISHINPIYPAPLIHPILWGSKEELKNQLLMYRISSNIDKDWYPK